MAIEDVIRQKILPEEHTLDMVVAETFGEEEESILQTAKLWTLNVSAYVGPQESCVHEARMAASFRLPMISYVSSLSCRFYDEETYTSILCCSALSCTSSYSLARLFNR